VTRRTITRETPAGAWDWRGARARARAMDARGRDARLPKSGTGGHHRDRGAPALARDSALDDSFRGRVGAAADEGSHEGEIAAVDEAYGQ
jgi:hypothetical protein